MKKEITPRTAGSGTGNAPVPQVGSVVVLSDDDVERIAGGYTPKVDGKQVGGTFTASALSGGAGRDILIG